MKHKIILAKLDSEILSLVSEIVERVGDDISIESVSDDKALIAKAKEFFVLLLIVDLKKCDQNDINFVLHFNELFPETTIVAFAEQISLDLEQVLRKRDIEIFHKDALTGAELSKIIYSVTKKYLDGGWIRDISPCSFLQLIEYEQKTCTLRIVEREKGKSGILFIKDGELMDGRLNGVRGPDSVYQILCWDQVDIYVEYGCCLKEKAVDGDLRKLILEAMRLKDENQRRGMDATEELIVAVDSSASDEQRSTVFSKILHRLNEIFGEKWRPLNIGFDKSKGPLISMLEEVGTLLGAGSLKVAYVKEGSNNTVIIPGREVVCLDVDIKFPRDKVLRIFSSEDLPWT